ncbi:MAG: hypothetical protein KJO05_05195 [Bacteroidia bacterium]|nr:hypothetical protein [Bacteroidia bacterium]NNF30986.1 hypothetical protein [Flavobacteriaceae bacterium]MBT8274948.1 hypothetical protein [Bacteroidia bacterium]NNJ82631.1 hypothetical protein [Flavobacteriaceae bacterium]NNK54930.1 hypothetical protein [Flavobacteriaceae bacterium]
MNNNIQVSTKRAITAIFIAWLLFIGVDFLFHAAILESLWKEEIPAIKPLDDLAILIPAGYASFLLLTTLIGFVFFRIFKTKPSLKEVFKFGLIFGLLFSAANITGLFSYVAIPLKQLLIFNLVYFIEILVVAIAIYHLAYSIKRKKVVWLSFLIFFGLVILAIVIQNITANL